ncbi:DNA starvation/stationary phase protection protein [Saccharopolyspora taberi]|uniref:DNA starvation/stationary phase protection protein n=1 Tax=Saccharopolyspora taberi TaxID=60895 RepID=A0ABN3VLQ8_9PSEU
MATKTVDKAPITSALTDSDRDTTGKVLQGALLDLVDLHLVAKQAHWNVVGRFFRDVHLQLDELIDSARGFADDVAERSAAIGVSPDGRSATVSSGSGLPAFGAGWKSDREVIEYIVSALSELIKRMRARIDETDKSDLVTQDLLIGISHEMEKSHWMWQAQLAGS